MQSNSMFVYIHSGNNGCSDFRGLEDKEVAIEMRRLISRIIITVSIATDTGTERRVEVEHSIRRSFVVNP